ncbi:uncharacterized protein PADG_05860 [Paracoccidioides brasiliensis Pb18]|uniref:Uncharacterized protein n=2 Tax=Paracoccidioides brasiliensis TaxID=121759 RepID=C1GF24_PARBD|nr:uncharacterized protein PADG_05860 [Paracoccidioides brasiliensis Pb18]EEH49781.2 hypothetical protein PADG_05860 [Paracoccidioides brasiliensis Pb18]ODH13333.1 hypothetical protein ACO22_07366 [Paracoccidioides brasiliensis]
MRLLLAAGTNATGLGEFAVENIHKIRFSNAPFNTLTIPEEKQKVIKSLPESRVSLTSGAGFDDVIAGKGQGVIVLLQDMSAPEAADTHYIKS